MVAGYDAHLVRTKRRTGRLVKSWLLLTTLVLALAPLRAQQPPSGAPPATANAPQPLDLNEAIARDVLEPLRAGMMSQNVKQVLSVFDADSFPDFAQFRDRLRPFLDSYSAVQFRYKILQATSPEEGKASVACEADLEGTPQDDGQVPLRRSTQLQLQLKQTPKGWQISSLTPTDFFSL